MELSDTPVLSYESEVVFLIAMPGESPFYVFTTHLVFSRMSIFIISFILLLQIFCVHADIFHLFPFTFASESTYF